MQKKKELGIPNGVKVLLSVGELNKNKNHEIIIRALSKLDKISDLFIFPSKREGLPVSLIEAIACGVPCVASDVRGNRDILSIDNLCKSNKEDEWRRLVQRGFYNYAKVNIVDNKFELSKIMKRFENIYFN